MRILLAEDDGLMRHMVAALLSARGHEVVPAADGHEAHRLFQAEPFPLVVLDWMMPGLDGPDLLKVIRASGARPYAILLSGHQEQNLQEEARKVGFRKVVPKPLDPSVLEAALAEAEAFLA